MSREIRLPPKWIELNVQKRECITYIPTDDDERICQCGKPKTDHSIAIVNQRSRGADFWIPSANTQLYPTDAHGSLVFEGEHYPNKAHYVRLAHDTNPELVVQMLTLVWGLPMPKLLITVRGGNNNFEIPTRIGKILQLGLIKAAKSTGAWIISNGLNRGVARHVGAALGNQRLLGVTRGRVVSIGIAPWGVVENKEALVGRNKERVYNPLQHPDSKYIILNPRHSNFLLVDNGSTGKLGGESTFRRRFEKCISSYPTSPHRGCDTPVVCVVVEGGFNILRTVADYLHDDPPTPVVIFAGTGRAADLITLVIKRVSSGADVEQTKDEVCAWMVKLFSTTPAQSAILFSEVRRIVSRRNLVTVFSPRRSSDSESFDRVLLASIFRSQHWTPLQQLSLALVWDRVDIATNEVFVYGRDWSREHLEHAVMQALVGDRLNFVTLLIEHGLNVQIFLTVSRLEALYHADHSSSWVMKTLLFEIAKIHNPRKKIDGASVQDRSMNLHDVGFVLSHMMGHVYKSRYLHMKTKSSESDSTGYNIGKNTFPQPFDDLFIWAVLTKRHKTALLLWRHGTGALAKSLVAVKLNKYLADELTSTEKTATNMAAEFSGYATEWEGLSLDLLDVCFKADPKMARQLLTMELEQWSNQTCLTLAVMANHRMLLGHPCCQILLADLWMGALNITKNTTLKILLGIVFIPAAFCLDYKTTEELMLLPHQGHVNPSKHELNLDQASLLTFTRSVRSVYSAALPVESTKESIRRIRQGKSGHMANLIKENRPHHLHTGIPHPGLVPPQVGKIIAVDAGQEDLRNNSVEAIAKRAGGHHRVTIDEPCSSESDGEMEELNVPNIGIDMKDGKYAWTHVNDGRGGESFVTTHQELGLWRKLYEFQKAPITNFYRHMLGFLVFLSTLAYVILVPQNREKIGYIEIYVIAYLSTLACEACREFICIDAYSWNQKWSVFKTKPWVIADAAVVGFFMLGLGLRCQNSYDPILFDYGVLIYKVSSIYWFLRLYKYMSVHRFVGPKIVMMSRMLKHMAYFAMIILVVLIAFGISRESIRFPDTPPTWKNMAEAFLEPYVMFYGEIDLDSLSPQCGDAGEPECPVGYWVVPLTWTIYMMVANILIVNVLIAVFNGIYSEVDAIAVELWMFQRFTFVMEFEQKPLLPPPLIAISHFHYIVRWFYGKFINCVCDSEAGEELLDFEENRNVILGNDHSLKTFLSPAEINRAFDFEEEHVDNISLGTTPYEDGINAVRKSMYTSAPMTDPAFNARGRLGPQGNFPFEFLEMENKGMADMQNRMADLFSELESQRAKLDRLISLVEEDQDGMLEDAL